MKAYLIRRSRRGFTLTEIAVVLGIIGLILGAIWVAASTVYNNQRAAQATTELLQITQAMRSFYATSRTVDLAVVMPITNNNVAPNNTYLLAGIFPSDTLRTAAGTASSVANPPTQAVNPWGGNIVITPGCSGLGCVFGDAFTVEFDKIPVQGCITLITSNVGAGRDSGMVRVVAAGPGVLQYPLTGQGGFSTTAIVTNPASTAATQCGQFAVNGNASVAFLFSLNGQGT